ARLFRFSCPPLSVDGSIAEKRNGTRYQADFWRSKNLSGQAKNGQNTRALRQDLAIDQPVRVERARVYRLRRAHHPRPVCVDTICGRPRIVEADRSENS